MSCFSFETGCKSTTNIWNTQGFLQKNANLFEFYSTKPCYSHKCATVVSKGTPLGEVVESTTNIWNTQIFVHFFAFFLKKVARSGLLELGDRRFTPSLSALCGLTSYPVSFRFAPPPDTGLFLLLFFEQHHPYEHRKHPVNDLFRPTFI